MGHSISHPSRDMLEGKVQSALAREEVALHGGIGWRVLLPHWWAGFHVLDGHNHGRLVWEMGPFIAKSVGCQKRQYLVTAIS